MIDRTGEQALLCSPEERLLEPSVRSAAHELTDWLADEFVEFGSSGRVYDKPPVIDALLAEQKDPPVERGAHDFQVQFLCMDVALVRYRSMSVYPDGSKFHSLRSSIWKIIDGRWRMAFHQGTLIPH